MCVIVSARLFCFASQCLRSTDMADANPDTSRDAARGTSRGGGRARRGQPLPLPRSRARSRSRSRSSRSSPSDDAGLQHSMIGSVHQEVAQYLHEAQQNLNVSVLYEQTARRQKAFAQRHFDKATKWPYVISVDDVYLGTICVDVVLLHYVVYLVQHTYRGYRMGKACAADDGSASSRGEFHGLGGCGGNFSDDPTVGAESDGGSSSADGAGARPQASSLPMSHKRPDPPRSRATPNRSGSTMSDLPMCLSCGS